MIIVNRFAMRPWRHSAALEFFSTAFLNGNQRVGHAALEIFLLSNGCEINVSVDDRERAILDLAAGSLTRDQFTAWLQEHVIEIKHQTTSRPPLTEIRAG